jgi:ABC-type phosphate transport system ATPase subunit
MPSGLLTIDCRSNKITAINGPSGSITNIDARNNDMKNQFSIINVDANVNYDPQNVAQYDPNPYTFWNWLKWLWNTLLSLIGLR